LAFGGEDVKTLNYLRYQAARAKRRLRCALGLDRPYRHPDARFTEWHDDAFESTFFGYYDRSPWSPGGGALLYAATSSPATRLPAGDEELTIGCFDLATGEPRRLGTTRTWNLQQAAQQQWVDNEHVLFNTHEDDRPLCRIVDARTGATDATYPFHAGMIHRGRGLAASYSFARLRDREVDYGVPLIEDPDADRRRPAAPAVELRSLADGSVSDQITFDDALAAHHAPEQVRDAYLYTQHVKFSPSGTRILFVLRSRRTAGSDWSRAIRSDLLVYDLDGGSLRVAFRGEEWSKGANHPVWYDDRHILLNAHVADRFENRFVTVDVETGDRRVLADRCRGTGHPTRLGSGPLLLTDESLRDAQQVKLIDPARNRETMLAQLRRGPRGPLRCDLHPRSSADGRQVCFDGLADGLRRLYVADLGPLGDAA
jgi:hypothetical protein